MEITTARKCILALLLCCSGWACEGGAAAGDKKTTKIPLVRFMRLTPSQGKNTLEALGSLSYYEKADVACKVEGRIDRIHVKEGALVHAGQVLARLEQISFRLALQDAQTELAQARNRLGIARIQYQDGVKNVLKQLAAIKKGWAEVLEKELMVKDAATQLSNTRALLQAGGVSRVAFQRAVTAYSSARVALELAQKNLHMLQIGYRDQDLQALGHKGPFSTRRRRTLLIRANTAKERAGIAAARNEVLKAANSLRQARILLRETLIRSPISGVVAVRSIEKGEQVKKDAALFTVMDTTRLYANLNVTEDDVTRIRTSGTVVVTVDALEGKTCTGIISLVHPLVDPRTRSVTVKVLLDNGNRVLKPGMFVRGTLELQARAQAWLLPVEAVQGRQQQEGHVYVLKEKTVFKTPVRLGKVAGDNIEILDGLGKGMLIAVPPRTEKESALTALQDGMGVTPVLPDHQGTKLGCASNRQPLPAPTKTNGLRLSFRLPGANQEGK